MYSQGVSFKIILTEWARLLLNGTPKEIHELCSTSPLSHKSFWIQSVLLKTQALLSDPQGHFRKKLPRKINSRPVEFFFFFFEKALSQASYLISFKEANPFRMIITASLGLETSRFDLITTTMRGVHTSYPEVGLLKECQRQCEREQITF